MKIRFDSLEDILQFADLVCVSLDRTELDTYDFLTPSQRERIEGALYDFMNLYYANDL